MLLNTPSYSVTSYYTSKYRCCAPKTSSLNIESTHKDPQVIIEIQQKKKKSNFNLSMMLYFPLANLACYSKITAQHGILQGGPLQGTYDWPWDHVQHHWGFLQNVRFDWTWTRKLRESFWFGKEIFLKLVSMIFFLQLNKLEHVFCWKVLVWGMIKSNTFNFLIIISEPYFNLQLTEFKDE